MESIKVDVSGGMKAIMVSRMCNNSCLFCHSSNHPNDYPAEDVSRCINEEIEGSESVIQLSGGEPTLRKDLFELLKVVRDKNERARIRLITNARLFYYKRFAKKLADLDMGIGIGTEIHGQNAKVHDGITQAPGSFSQTVRGIRNLLDEKIDVELRVIVHKMNHMHLPDIARFVESEFPEIAVLFFYNCWPSGHAYANRDIIVGKLNDVAQSLEKAADAMSIEPVFLHFPYCLFRKKYRRFVREQRFHVGEREAHPLDECEECSLCDRCPGVWKTYLKIMGNDEFNAIRDD